MDGSENGRPRTEPPPVMPYELTLNNSVVHYQPLDNGGMLLTMTPCMATPGGLALMPPQIKLVFGAEGWERFKKEVAADGEKGPAVFVPPANFPFKPPV